MWEMWDMYAIREVQLRAEIAKLKALAVMDSAAISGLKGLAATWKTAALIALATAAFFFGSYCKAMRWI